MHELKLREKARALVVVAHPDDETIWMGGTIMKHPKVKWTVFSLCRADDADRAPKFGRVMEKYGAKGIISNLDDEDRLTLDETIPVIKELARENLADTRPDYLFCHNANGEYGHERHIGAHRAVREMVQEGALRPDKFFCFSYKKNPENEQQMIASEEARFFVSLSGQEFEAKKRIVADMYGYDYDGIDVGLCTNPEAFELG